MSRIEIHADGRQIIVDHEGADLAYVIKQAMRTWKDTAKGRSKRAGFKPPAPVTAKEDT